MPPPAALFNLTRKHWLSTTSFHSTTLIVPHPANLPEPSWSKLTLSTRTHEHDEYLSPRPRSGSPRLGCTRQSTHAVTVSAPPMPIECPCPYPPSQAHAHACPCMDVSIDLHLPHHISHSRRCPLPPCHRPLLRRCPPRATHTDRGEPKIGAQQLVRQPFAEYPSKSSMTSLN